jgi:hypothetical protein
MALTLAAQFAPAAAQAPSPAFKEFADKAIEVCGNIALKAKDVKVMDYCLAEVMRPIMRGKSCIAYVAETAIPAITVRRVFSTTIRRK